MPLIPDEVVAEVRERVDIVMVIGEHVQLRKAGVNHKGLCPFHQEKTPSFHVNQVRRSFYCFGCQKKGDVYKFLMELQGKSFVEVVKELAARVGVDVPERPPSAAEMEWKSERARLLDLNAATATFYEGTLAAGGAGRTYLQSRGIGEEIAHGFRLGMAPDAWDALALHLESRKVRAEDAVTLGLIAPRKQQGRGYYDKFRNRLMCPVILPAGEVVGFSGRTLAPSDPETPKYVNSPESPVYRKADLLFGLHAARAAFSRKERAILVEGNFDVIALHQAGFAEAVAPLGTALTEQQVKQLHRFARSVVLCLDGDKAGRAATLRGIPLLVKEGVIVSVVLLPDGEDPDSFVRKNGADALEQLIKHGQPAHLYYMRHLWAQAGRSPEQQAEALREIVGLIPDDHRREIYIRDIAQELRVDERIVRGMLRNPAQAVPAPSKPKATTLPPPQSELKLFGILADHPSLRALADQLDVRSLLTDVRLRDMYSAAQADRSFLDVAPTEISDLVATAVMSGQYAALADPRRTLEEAVRNLRRERLEAQAEELRRELKAAEARGDIARARELLQQQVQTRKRLEEDPR